MQLDTVDDLIAGPGQVVVDVAAAGVGFVDTLVVAGRYQTLPPLPFAAGMEFAGTVRAIGEGVEGFAPGDRVVGYVLNGAFAEQVVARPNELFPLPSDISFEEGAVLCMPYLTAWFALTDRGQVQPGDNVLIGGASGAVGLAAVQLAKAMGARVLACVRSDADAAIARQAGADAIIDLAVPDLRDALREQVMAASDGHGADVVLDPLGGDFLTAALRAAAWRGRIVVIGFAAGDIPTVRVNYLLIKTLSIAGLDLSHFRDRMPEAVARAQARIFELHAQGALAPRIARRFPLEQLPEALEFVAAGRTGGRAVLTIRTMTA